jgi:G3E family GTPase
VTVLDAKRGPAQVADHEECRHQLERAGLIVMTKVDLASEDERMAARTLARRLAPAAPMLDSARGALPFEAAMAAIENPAGHRHDHHHSPHEHRHAATLSTSFLPLPEPVEHAALERACIEAQAHFGVELLRLKGIVSLDGAGPRGIQLDDDGTIDVVPLGAGAGGTLRLGMTVIARTVASSDVASFLIESLDRSSVDRELTVGDAR